MSAAIKKRNLLPFFDMAYQVMGKIRVTPDLSIIHSEISVLYMLFLA